ncbi:MAG TPA: hypothetical protein VLF88_01755 [Candidatus Babeliales bacterium]|nr:hypothetical protein [Candidatus Babeliales bacterium]
MAEPARQLDNNPDDQVYDTGGNTQSEPKPDLRALEGGGETSEPKQGHLSSVSDQLSKDELSDVEESGGEDDFGEEESFYRHTADDKKPGRFNIVGRARRRYAIFGGGMLGTIIALILFLTLSSGPLQFIHIAQQMMQFHFSHQQDAGDDRMGRIYRYARAGGQAGETRVGYLGSKMHANILTDLEKIGLKPDYVGLAGAYEGFTIDRSSPNSPFNGMSDEELQAALQEKGVNVKEISFDGEKAKVSVKGYINQRRSLGFLASQAGESKIPTALRVRIMSRYGLVSWHPMKILDKKLNQSLADRYTKWRADQEDNLKNGVKDTVTLDETTGSQGTDEKGKPIPLSPEDKATAAAAPKNPETTKNVLGSLRDSKGIGIAGGLAAASGVACSLKAVNDNIGAIRYAQVVEPLIRMGMEAVTVGSQIMTGQEVDPDALSFLSKNLNQVDSKGNNISSWNDAKSIQHEQGHSGGIDMDQGTKDILAGQQIGWLGWTKKLDGTGICTGVGQAITGIVSVGLGILSGETISTLSGIVVNATLSSKVIDWASNLLSGNAINVLATGPEWGNDVNYGSRLAANSMSLQFGGTALDNTESAQLDAAQAAKSRSEFGSKNISYRLFNPYDQRSAISKVIDGSSPSFTQNINKFATGLVHFGNLTAGASKLFSSKAAAADQYDYGFPEYGFSEADLNNPLVADPYANADQAAVILDGANGDTYLQKAKSCFGVDIKQVPNPNDSTKKLWDVVPADSPVNPYDPDKYHSDCKHPTDQGINQDDWLRLRFFIFDTGVMEGYACHKGDELSCTNDGVDSSPADSSSSQEGGGTLPDGNAKELSSQLMKYVKNGKVTCLSSGCPDIRDTASGKSIKYGSCNVDTLDPSLVGMLLELAQMGHTFFLSAVCTDHASNPTSLHHQGKAADFNFIDGVFMGPSPTEAWSPAKIAAASKLDRDITSFMPKSTGFGQQQCHAEFDFLKGFDLFDDDCHHQHVQVGN